MLQMTHNFVTWLEVHHFSEENWYFSRKGGGARVETWEGTCFLERNFCRLEVENQTGCNINQGILLQNQFLVICLFNKCWAVIKMGSWKNGGQGSKAEDHLPKCPLKIHNLWVNSWRAHYSHFIICPATSLNQEKGVWFKRKVQEFGNLVKMGCFSFHSPFSVAFARSDAAQHKYNAARGDVAS